MKYFLKNYNLGQSVWLILPIFFVLPGTNALGFALCLAFSFFLIIRYKLVTNRSALLIASFLVIFSLLRIAFSKDFLSFANIKTSAGYLAYILLALNISRFKNKYFYYSLLIFPFIFLAFSFLLTYFFDPSILLDRKILDTPMFLIVEWGPSFVFFNLALISSSLYFLHNRMFFFYIFSQIALFIAIFYGVRAILPVLAFSFVYYLFLYKINKKTLSVIVLNSTLFVLFNFFISPALVSHLHSKIIAKLSVEKNINSAKNTQNAPVSSSLTEVAEIKTNLPPIVRNWDSPRTSMIKDVLTNEFLLKNFFGGKKTTFSHHDFVNNSHNFFVDAYWNNGFFALISLLFGFLFFLISKPRSLNVFIFFGHFLTLNLNLTPPWFIIIVFSFLIISKDFERELS